MRISDDLVIQFVEGTDRFPDHVVLAEDTSGVELAWPILGGRSGWTDLSQHIDRWAQEAGSPTGPGHTRVTSIPSRADQWIALDSMTIARLAFAVGYFYGQWAAR